MAGFSMALATVIAGAGASGAAVYGAKKASSANREAMRTTTAANDKALAFEERREDRRQTEWDAEQDMLERQWNAGEQRADRLERREDERWRIDDARATRGENMDRQIYNDRAPYRGASVAALNEMMTLAGLTPAPTTTMPMVAGETAPAYTDSAPKPAVAASTGVPQAGQDGLIEMTLPREQYDTLIKESAPIVQAPRRSYRGFTQPTAVPRSA
jgi:hypothetical protein